MTDPADKASEDEQDVHRGRRLRLRAAVLAGVAAGLGGWVMVVGAVPGERRLSAGLRVATGGFLERAARVVDSGTDLLPLAVVTAGGLVALLVMHRPADAVTLGACVAGVWAVNPLLKALVGRPRPDLGPAVDAVSADSFPSGHAADTTALLGGLLLVLRSRRVRLVAAAVGAAALAIVGLGQLALGLHHPSDVLAGWLWAAAWAALLGSMRRPADVGRSRPAGPSG